MIIRRKVKCRTHQAWTAKIREYLNEKPYYEYMIAEYEEGTWESEDLMEAYMGQTYPGETPRYVYDHAVLSSGEYDEWVTMSGTTASG